MLNLNLSTAAFLFVVFLAAAASIGGCANRGDDTMGFWQNQDRKGAGRL